MFIAMATIFLILITNNNFLEESFTYLDHFSLVWLILVNFSTFRKPWKNQEISKWLLFDNMTSFHVMWRHQLMLRTSKETVVDVLSVLYVSLSSLLNSRSCKEGCKIVPGGQPKARTPNVTILYENDFTTYTSCMGTIQMVTNLSGRFYRYSLSSCNLKKKSSSSQRLCSWANSTL